MNGPKVALYLPSTSQCPGYSLPCVAAWIYAVVILLLLELENQKMTGNLTTLMPKLFPTKMLYQTIIPELFQMSNMSCDLW